MNYICTRNMAETSHKRKGSSRGKWAALLMVIAILAITGFQGYWLKNNYDREKQNLDIRTNSSFRQTILKLQASKLKLEKINVRVNGERFSEPGFPPNRQRPFNRWNRRRDPVITMMNLLQEKMRDSLANDSARNKTFIDVRNSLPIKPNFDSLQGNGKTKIRSVTISQSMDSLSIAPELIREVSVHKEKNSPDRIIIGYGSKPIEELKGETGMPGRGAVFMGDRPPGSDNESEDVVLRNGGGIPPSPSTFFQFLYNMDSLSVKDSVTVKEVTDAFSTRLKEENIGVEFSVNKLDSAVDGAMNMVTIGFAHPISFELKLDSIFGYMMNKLKLPVLFSLLLIGITLASFILLYRNMIRQQRLSTLKNDFISNITHELKTPIATVGVAIEALRNFNAIDDAQRTREYLDISQNELQRLNLLVDKVLKLSIFENREIELKKEWFDLRQLAEEVMNSMKLQFEKYHAKTSLVAKGDNFSIEADKLHITSVIYNLLDNALKYSKENPEIHLTLQSHDQYVSLSVKDNGIGIPPEYKGKVFEKFFRVPTGDRHNIKGYGLGLSYVSEVIRRHHGHTIVESEQGKESIFTVNIPYKDASAKK
jgi:two-component system phosphate regulon sensor histidine kinase PhoR